MSNKQKTVFWFIAFLISLSFSIYAFSDTSYDPKLSNETNIVFLNSCKIVPDVNVEWCEMHYDKEKNKVIIISPENSTITTISDKFDIISKVVKVVDGDTIDLASGERVRLSIANTPERGQEGYALATQFTKNLCLGKDAKVDLDDGQKAGSFDRIIGLVYCGGENLNERLIEGGYAVVWQQYCKVSEFADTLCK
jgi:endonuclease YncB( thermonuclease family)